LISFLKKEVPDLDEDDIKILKKAKITGNSFLNFTKNDLVNLAKLEAGPAVAISTLIQEINDSMFYISLISVIWITSLKNIF